MAKRPLQFESPEKTKFPKHLPLSPSDVTTSDQHATITGVLASLSPLRPSHYFDGELTDGQSIIRGCWFQ